MVSKAVEQILQPKHEQHTDKILMDRNSSNIQLDTQ